MEENKILSIQLIYELYNHDDFLKNFDQNIEVHMNDEIKKDLLIHVNRLNLVKHMSMKNPIRLSL
jgi:hypothetical protein